MINTTLAVAINWTRITNSSYLQLCWSDLLKFQIKKLLSRLNICYYGITKIVLQLI